jgi:Alkylmercury lyase
MPLENTESVEGSLSQLHYEIVRGLLEHSACPTNPELAKQLGVSTAQVEQLLRGLSDIHGLVLHPHVCEPWVVHPFSITPTLNWIEGHGRGWWAPCVWCAFGVAHLVGGEVRIHTRIGGEAQALSIPVTNGQPVNRDELWVHFAIPPAQAWQNVHQHCAMVLPFRSPDEIQRWCERYRLPRGEAVPLNQVARLAQLWYGRHARSDWRKWTVAEAQDIFNQAGLRSSFWQLGAGDGKY